ncbi:MAG: hypothetical protein OEV44_14665 [Spirochaetota bacterium]|nr:hypothetical protein [Spirochaetota bacterium]
MKIILKTILVNLLFTLFLINSFSLKAFSQDKTGIMIGGELSGGILKPNLTFFNTTNSTSDTSFFASISFVGEWDFKDYLGLGFGLGSKFFTIKGSGNSQAVKYTAIVSNIPLTLRFKPVSLISNNSSFSSFVGTGLNLHMSLYSKRNYPNATNSTLSSSWGWLSEAGIGYYISEDILLQTIAKYNLGLTDLDKRSKDKIILNYFEVTVGILFRL